MSAESYHRCSNCGGRVLDGSLCPRCTDLFSDPVARATDPGTSWGAARSITPGRTEAAILSLFEDGTELTDDEIVAGLPWHHAPTVKTARSRLTKGGVLIDSAIRRSSNRGRDMIVWRLAP